RDLRSAPDCAAHPPPLHSFPTRRSSDLRVPIPWTGNAWQWYANAEALGYAVGATPRPGAIMVTWESRYFGHVAYVESVDETDGRSEEHTSELQSRGHLVCRLLLEKKNGT